MFSFYMVGKDMKKLLITAAIASLGLVSTPAFASGGCSCGSGGGHSAMAASPNATAANGSASVRRFSYDPSMNAPAYRAMTPRGRQSFGTRGADSKPLGNY